MLFVEAENGHGDMTSLVCLDALHEAYCELEQAQLRWRQAANALATVRSRLNQAVDLADQQPSFGPLGTLFCDEETAKADYEGAVCRLAAAEERWFALSSALACEKEMMLKGQVSRRRMN